MTARPPAPDLSAEEAAVVARFEAAPVIEEAWDAQRGHFVTIRLEYVDNQRGGRTPWKRRGRCTCGWQCLSWDPLRPILIADGHAREAAQLEALAQGRLVDEISAGTR